VTACAACGAEVCPDCPALCDPCLEASERRARRRAAVSDHISTAEYRERRKSELRRRDGPSRFS
jgi:hypothetical protein